MKKNDISWSVAEYEKTTKRKEWFWVLGILTLALVLAALLLKNILFASFILLAGFTLALYAVKKPRIINYSISGRGIKIGENLYLYESLKSFWIRYDPPRKKELEIITKKIVFPRLVLPLGDADPNEIRSILTQILKEEEVPESVTEIISERIGF